MGEGRAEATISKARWFLEQLEPAIGTMPISDVDPQMLLGALKRLEAKGRHETAKKCRSFASRVFRYGVATGRCKADPAQLLNGALITPKARHYAAILEPARRQDEGAARSRRPFVPAGERNADRASRAYRRGQICVPVRLFASRPMSENTLNASFRRMGFGKDEVTAHGLRATPSTMLNESGHWNPDAIERALADGESNATRGAYHRGLYGDERVKMGQWWSD